MNPTAIYSKTGKGVQEASGKTSHLSRGDRAILAAIDGKMSLQQLSAKFDRAADDKFYALIGKMDADGFIREVSPGTVQRGAANAPRPGAAKPAAKPAGGGSGEDLDFTQIFSAPPKMERPSVPSGPPSVTSKDPMAAAREAAEARARAERGAKAQAEAAEKAAMMSTQQVRMDAELRAKIEREKVMAAAAEGKTRAEIEARERAEREAQERAQAEARAKAEAAVRAKAQAEREAQERAAREKADAERLAKEKAARDAHDSAEMERLAKERSAQEARDKVQAAERARFEAAERARREAEELRFKIEEERRAREEAERRAREEAERTRREAEERARREAEEKKAHAEAEALRLKYEEEKKAREDAERRAEEARSQRERERQAEENKAREEYERQEAARRAAEEASRAAREAVERKEAEEHQRQIRLAREAEDKKRRDADARKKKEEEARRWEQEEARRKSDEVYRVRAEQEDKERAEREALESVERAEADKKAAAEADALSGSLLADFDSFSQREDEDRKAKEAAEQQARAEAGRAEAERVQRERDEAEKKARRAEEKRKREEEEARLREEAEQREREQEARRKEEEAERNRKEREETARRKEDTDIPISSADLGRGDVAEDERKLSPEARRALRDREREVARARSRGETAGGTVAAAYRRKRQPAKWGKPVAIFLFLTLALGATVANFVPLDTKEYEALAAEALGVPVKIGSANLYVFDGIEVRFTRVSVGDTVKIAKVHAVPEFGALFGTAKAFGRVELLDLVLRQDALGDMLFGTMKPGRLRMARVTATGARLEGPLALPALDFDASVGDSGKVFSIRLSGENVTGLVTPRSDDITFEVSARNVAVPFLKEFSLTEFAMKGSADRQGMTVSAFDGRAFDGTLLGNARIQWGERWSVQGDVQARTMNAAVFSPQLVSEGRLGAKGRYAMSGPDAAKLYESARLDGEFEVAKGALGSFDISRALQSTSAQASGRTQFSELQGTVSLANGALAFRDLRLSAGLLNASGTLDVDAKGGLSGRINAELRNLRGTMYIGGRLADPQLRR
jgi:hypothetical protein